MKRSQKSSSPIFSSEVKAKAVLGVRDTLKCGPGKKGVQKPNVAMLNEPRETEGHVWFRNSGLMSLRDACLGKPRVCATDLSPQAMLIPDAKAAVDKE